MKNILKHKIKILLVVMIAFMASCTKDITDMRLNPQIETSDVTEIGSATVTITGFVVASGENGFSERGICYNKTGDPTVDDTKVLYEGEDNNATFSVTLTGLDYVTTYYAKAYGINSSGVVYGSDTTFTTNPVLATVTTDDVSDTTSFSATCGGNITNAGGAVITQRGVCWNTVPTNLYIDSCSFTKDGTGTGAFVSSMTGLQGLTKYYVRAYAKNAVGVAYGDTVSFTTKVIPYKKWYMPGDHQGGAGWDPATAPTIANTLSDPNTLSGYAWLNAQFKFTEGPDWTDSWGDTGADGIMEYNSPDNIQVLTPGYYLVTVDYSAKTYTLQLTDWGIIGDATPGGWDNDTNMTYSSVSGKWNITLTLAAGDMKFRANDAWTLDYGDDGADGSLEQGGANIAVTAGDYTVTLDLSQPNNYTYGVNYWGIIGDATPGSWTTDTDMSIVPGTNQWTVTLDLTVGQIKFRANDAWNLDYGDTGADNILDQGGDNINISTAGNYTITIDFDTMAYTMVLN